VSHPACAIAVSAAIDGHVYSGKGRGGWLINLRNVCTA